MLPVDLELNRPIWIHAVSVGEVMAIKGLLKGLREVYPQERFVISTVTPTGNKIAKGIASKSDFVTYLPLDFSFIVKKVVDKVNPSLFIIAETEIWPNLIHYFYLKNIPVVVVNGRISDRSFKGYRSIRYLLQPVLEKISLFCVQSESDAQRLFCLGVDRDKVRITGNIKFDTADYTDKKSTDYTDYKMKLGLQDKEKLLVAGSTHHGEEEIVLIAYQELKKQFTDLRLLIAPRHPERSDEIANLIKKFGFKFEMLSRRIDRGVSRETIFILDTIGELLSFYAIADIVFVGGSLVKKGGHNILEPASLGKPVLFGPYMFNFRDIAEMFLKAEAALVVDNEQDLVEKVEQLLRYPAKIDEMARRAKGLITENQGATKRNLESIKIILEGAKGK
jgi:3-deoxy-D-manno-octulosonic-acid transferase